jgi:hypothetical protein
MKWTVLIIALMVLLCTNAFGQMDPYSSNVAGNAPTPSTPSSAESLGLQAPTDVTTSVQAPSAQENTQTLMSTSQDAAYASAPAGSRGTAANAVYNKMIVPPGGFAPNSLYVSYAPQTVASSNLYANLPLWMKISGKGNAWFYEWYPSGALDTNYIGYISYTGWYKRWFFADTPGWHILQYYCNGWSNYAYIYVYGAGGYSVNPNPSPSPMPYPYPYWNNPITYTYPSTGHTYYSHQWTTSTDYGE